MPCFTLSRLIYYKKVNNKNVFNLGAIIKTQLNQLQVNLRKNNIFEKKCSHVLISRHKQKRMMTNLCLCRFK